MPDRSSVDIIMGTYNGARYVGAQLESLFAQTFQNWRLLVRDDGSQDETVAVVTAAAKADARVQLVSDNFGNLGCNRNFHHLLKLTTARYVMYCDQDDVWLPGKVELTLREMVRSEDRNGKQPTLVHCDAIVTNSNLSVIKKHFIGSRGSGSGLSAILFANCVQGAASMINAALREKILQMEPILPYDYHAGLIAAALGERRFINRGLFLYRQHSQNLIGAGGARGQPISSEVSSTLHLAIRAFPAVQKTIACFANELSPAVAKELDDFSEVLFGTDIFKRLAVALRRRYSFYRRRDRLNIFLYICHLHNV